MHSSWQSHSDERIAKLELHSLREKLWSRFCLSSKSFDESFGEGATSVNLNDLTNQLLLLSL